LPQALVPLKRGDLDAAAQILRGLARYAEQPCHLGSVAWLLAGMLADRGDLDGLCARTDAGDHEAAKRLAGMLADRGDLDELRTRADAGDEYAFRRLAHALADVLVKQGWDEGVERLHRFGLNLDGSIARA
jgi:hypothetical protein